MTRHRLLLLAALLTAGAIPALGAAPRHAAHHHTRRDSGAVVLLSARPGTSQDRAARLLNAHDLRAAMRHGETPLVLVGSSRLAGRGGDPALFVQLQSARLCGSAGCSTSVYLRHDRQWRKVLDSVSGPIRVMPQRHDGVHDLMVGRDDRWIWDGHVYQDSLAAPPLDNLRRSVEQHRARMRRRESL